MKPFNIQLLRPAGEFPADEVTINIRRDTICIVPPATTGAIRVEDIEGNYAPFLDKPLTVVGPIADARHTLSVATRYFRMLGVISPKLDLENPTNAA